MKKRKWLITVLLVAAGLAAVLRLPLPFQDRTRIDTVVSIEQPDTIVFDYVTTPANWPRWHPSSLAVSGATDHPLGVGEQVTEEYRVAGRHGHVQWTVTARNRPRQWAIEGAIDGRKAGTVTYTLTPTAHGTRFEREFVYDAPTLLFAILNRLLLRQRIEAESEEAVERLKTVLEARPAARR